MLARIVTAGMLISALAGCGGEDAPERKTRSIAVATSPQIEQLKRLSALNRGLALRRAIQDAGETCKRVEKSSYQRDWDNFSMWTARCSEGRDWALFIAPNDDVQVRNCADAEQLKLPECWITEG